MPRTIRGSLGLLLCLATAAFGQSATLKPAFEVATIKPSPSPAAARAAGMRMGITVDGARAQYTGLSLLILVVQAYGLKGYQVTSPEWMNATRFDIVAKLPDGSSPEQAPEMLQTLLEDRFKLTYHRGTKEFSVYVLIPGKDGPKLTARPADYDSSVKTGPKPTTITALANRMAQTVDRPVLDLTNIKGEYMVDSPELTRAITQSLMATINSSSAATGSGANEPSTAAFELAQKLGLKLEARKMPLPTLVVDHMEKTPVEN